MLAWTIEPGETSSGQESWMPWLYTLGFVLGTFAYRILQ
jgi:hypothetical protein